MARPLKHIDANQVLELARIQCTYAEMCAVLDVSDKTLRKRFSALIEKGREEGKQSLRRAQWRKALDGNTTMMIWLGKQELGQTDRQDVKVGNMEALTDEQLMALAAGRAPHQ